MLKNFKVLAISLTTLAGLTILSAHAADTASFTPPKDPVIVVDKKANQLYLADYNEGHLDIRKTYHATLGKKVGDKLMEGDLKTPEGIYDFLYLKQAPQLRAIFGPLAAYIGYPNVMDKNGSKTGNDIMLHGTDNPSRLEKNFDSLGCVVLDNANVKEVISFLKMHDTKIIITKDFSVLKDSPRVDKAKAFFERWIKAWSDKDLTTYIESYSDEFMSEHMNRLQYAKFKDSLNKKYDTINVTASNVHVYLHEKYDLITFTQHYKSTFKGGHQAFSGNSEKSLYIQERNGEYRILKEESIKQ